MKNFRGHKSEKNKDKIMTEDTINPGATAQYKLLQQSEEKLAVVIEREVNVYSFKKSKADMWNAKRTTGTRAEKLKQPKTLCYKEGQMN
jgi:hypothetical protein